MQSYNRRQFVYTAVQTGGLLFASQALFAKAGFGSIISHKISNMQTQTLEESVKQYVSAWNEKGTENIQAAIQKCWTAASTYADPNNAPTKGFDGLVGLIQKAQAQTPDAKFTLLSKVDAHHGSGRFAWKLEAQGELITEGLDYFEHDAENRITRIVGFFGVLK